MSSPPNWTFNAREHQPTQGGSSAHPVGKHKFTITKTQVVANKDNTGGMLRVTFTSDKGSINNNYNLWNQNETAVKIANSELSALCHAVGVYNLSSAEGSELLNAQGVMEVDYQTHTEEQKKANKPPFVEIKKIFDINGNEPGTQAAPSSGNVPTGAPQAATPWAQAPTSAAPAQTPPATTGSPPWAAATPTGGQPAQPSWNSPTAASAPASTPPWQR